MLFRSVGMNVVLVEEGSVNSHLEVSITRDSVVSGHLSVVSNYTTELWEFFLGSINGEVLVNSSFNGSLDLSFNSLDKCWDKTVLNEWNENGSNLGNESTGKFNINISWVDSDVSLLDSKLWSEFP